jgi:tricorn protease-like protein
MSPDCTAYIILDKHGMETARFPTIGELQAVFWSPNGKYVAINNRRGESGDYLWVISTDTGSVIHKPDNDLPMQHEIKNFPEYAHLELHKEWIVPKGWDSNNILLVRVDDVYSNASDYLRIDVNYLVDSKALHLRSQSAKKFPRG